MPSHCVNWAYQGRPVYNEEKARAYVCAKVVLNSMMYSEIWGLNARAFEAAGIGAFQMIDWRPGLSNLFEDGREVVSYKSIAQLKSLLAYYLPREDDRHAIAAAGKRRAIAEHTYGHRLTLLLETVAGRAKGFDLPALSGELVETIN
jgi:spore maturation protein CgeB